MSEIQSILIGRFSTTFSALAETLDNQEEPEKLTIEPTVKNQSLPLAVSYVGQSPEAAQKQLAQYIQQVDDQVNEELEKDLKDNIALRMKNLQDSLKTQEVVAQEQKELRIRQIQEALQYANQAQVTKPQIQQTQDVTRIPCSFWGVMHWSRWLSTKRAVRWCSRQPTIRLVKTCWISKA